MIIAASIFSSMPRDHHVISCCISIGWFAVVGHKAVTQWDGPP